MKRITIALAVFFLAAFSLAAQDTDNKINKKNLVIKEWNADAKMTSRKLDHVTTYNSDGRKIEEIEYGAEGQKWRKRFEYGASGKCIKEYEYDHANHLLTVKKFEYNEFGRKKIQYTYNHKGKLLTVKTFEYIISDAE